MEVVQVLVLCVPHGLDPDVVEDCSQLIGHIGYMSRLVLSSKAKEGEPVLLRYSLLSFHNLIIHEGLKLESQVSLKILRKLSPLSIKPLLDAFEKIDWFLARTKNFHIAVADLEQLEKIVAVEVNFGL